MALSNIQEIVERSIYEAIRKLLVSEGYIADVRDNLAFPKNGEDLSEAGQVAWDASLKSIQQAKQFAVEIFNNSSSQTKGLKRVPRITIIPRRLMPGELGMEPGYTTKQSEADPNAFENFENPSETSHLWLDVILTSNSTKQERFLNAVLGKVIGAKKFIPRYDKPTEKFFIKQTNYYDIPDTQEGIEEKVYSFEVPDLIMFGEKIGNTSIINMITMETKITDILKNVDANGVIIGPYADGDNLIVDLSGITF